MELILNQSAAYCIWVLMTMNILVSLFLEKEIKKGHSYKYYVFQKKKNISKVGWSIGSLFSYRYGHIILTYLYLSVGDLAIAEEKCEKAKAELTETLAELGEI